MGQAALVTSRQPEAIVRVHHFSKRYRKQSAVQSLDLQIQAGEIYGLIGPDGAGKSSLMKAIAGVLSYEGGVVEVFGIPVDSEAAAERIKARIGFMPQGLGLNLYAELSVEENIDFFAQLREVPPELLAERKEKLLAMTRLKAFRDRPMKKLSGGMKQKLGLVCTLIHEPDLVILDEPTTGVDPVSRRDFWAILAALLREQGITALVSTAYMDEAARFHRLSLMYDGRVLAEGEPDTIRQVVSASLVEVVTSPQMAAQQRLKQSFQQVESVGPVLRVLVENASPQEAERQVTESLDGLSIERIQADEPGLEDVFVALLRRREKAAVEAADVVDIGPAAPMQDNGIAILADGLIRDFGAFRAVDKVSFEVRQGEIFGLLGANGAGKTTVIKMLTGILPPSGGEGQVAGADMRRAGQAIKARIGYMSQAFSLYQDMTVLENIRLYAHIYAVPFRQVKQRVAWVIRMAGLQGVENRLAGALPMGIRQRLALGCALVHQPGVLFLDEPTSGVDPVGRRRFWDILVRMARVERVAILVTTHYMSEAEHCDHLALMHAGQVIADAAPQQLKEALQREAGVLLEIRVDKPLVALELLEQAGFEGVALFGKRIHLLAQDPQQAERAIDQLMLRHGLSLLHVSPRVPTLEDVFVYRIMAREKAERRQ